MWQIRGWKVPRARVLKHSLRNRFLILALLSCDHVLDGEKPMQNWRAGYVESHTSHTHTDCMLRTPTTKTHRDRNQQTFPPTERKEQQTTDKFTQFVLLCFCVCAQQQLDVITHDCQLLFLALPRCVKSQSFPAMPLSQASDLPAWKSNWRQSGQTVRHHNRGERCRWSASPGAGSYPLCHCHCEKTWCNSTSFGEEEEFNFYLYIIFSFVSLLIFSFLLFLRMHL